MRRILSVLLLLGLAGCSGPRCRGPREDGPPADAGSAWLGGIVYDSLSDCLERDPAEATSYEDAPHKPLP